MQPTRATSSDLIGRVRIAAGLSRKEIARRLMVSELAVANLESGIWSLRISTLARIVDRCGADLVLDFHLRSPSASEEPIESRLSWTPAQRLQYLTDVAEFEKIVDRARPLGKLPELCALLEEKTAAS